jgi:hypothetical protein
MIELPVANLMISRKSVNWLAQNYPNVRELEPILNILCNYQTGFVLSDDKLAILRGWLEESEAHEEMLDDLANKMKWHLDEIDGNERERIQTRLIAMEETDS